MILVAFVLVLVATVMLIIGTFFDGGTAYIWISIGACVATFGVLAASYFARRRGADDEGARPQPLGAGESRPASVQSAPRGTTVGAGGTATATRDRTEAESEPEAEEAADEPSVTIVPSAGDETPDGAADETPDEAADETPDEAADEVEEAEPMAPAPTASDADEEEAEPEPAPRRVAPRRVVRREDAEEVSDAATADTGEEAPEEAPAPAASGGMRRVAASGATADGTRRVVRRASAAGGTRRVVRRAGGAEGEGQRTVKRVVRRAPAAEESAPAEQPEQKKDGPDRSGTRGKRARAVLSEIKGVGPAKQDALLKRFGSLENMAAASVDDLADVKGVGGSVAEAIKKTLQDR